MATGGPSSEQQQVGTNIDLEEERKNARTRKMSIHEGNFGVFSSVISDNYTVPFSLAVNSTPFQAGILGASAGIISPLGQFVGSRAMEKHSRRGVLLTGILGQAFLMATFMFLAFSYQTELIGSEITWALLFLAIFYFFSGGMMGPPWVSLMGDVIPEEGRGRYFAKRNLINNIIALSGTLLIAIMLDWYKAIEMVIWGFVFVFLIGCITRIFSFIFFTQHYFPPFDFQPTDHIKFTDFVRELPKSNFGHFTIFVALLVFGQWIAGPFFTIYMLEELGFTYTELILVNLSTSAFGLFLFPVFGKIADKYGNVLLLRLGAIIIPFLPFMWLFLRTPTEIILGPQLFGGIGWTAFNFATSNMIYDNIPAHKRGEYVAFYNIFLGIGIISGGIIGSLLVAFAPEQFMDIYLFIFLLSFIVRGIVVIIFLPKIKEVRAVKAKPIYNVKNAAIYKWLHEMMFREHSKHNGQKKNHNKNHK